MTIQLLPLTPEFASAVQSFNRRLQARGVRVALQPDERVLEDCGDSLYQRRFIAVDRGHAVRGLYMLKNQRCLIDGNVTDVGCYQIPISEGAVDPQYNLVSLRLLWHALAQQPLLFSLGMGGRTQPMPRLLVASGWKLAEVPLYFRVLNAKAFFGNLVSLRRSRWRRYLCNMLAWTGSGALLTSCLQASKWRPGAEALDVERVDQFGLWCDAVWDQAGPAYRFVAARTASTLNRLYPRDDGRFIRCRMLRGSQTVGWTVLLATPMHGHRHFHNMRVGTIVDGLAAPQDCPAVVRAATRQLKRLQVDLVVSNQSHQAWQLALSRSGFLTAPSNFVFAASPQLAGRLGELNRSLSQCHLNRGDCDGPLSLLHGR